MPSRRSGDGFDGDPASLARDNKNCDNLSKRNYKCVDNIYEFFVPSYFTETEVYVVLTMIGPHCYGDSLIVIPVTYKMWISIEILSYLAHVTALLRYLSIFNSRVSSRAYEDCSICLSLCITSTSCRNIDNGSLLLQGL